MEKYIKDGQVGVLVSGGYGAGWSTWDYENGLNLALDKRIIEYWLNNKKNLSEDKMMDFLESIGYKHVCCGGLGGLRLEMVDECSAVKITEYDGFESLEVGYSEFTTV